MPAMPIARPLELLKEYFGYSEFRPQQADIIQSVAVERCDTLVLMPTGGGKSVCYQIPALMHDGLTVVVSPLIALMKDQVEALRLNGINAAFLNSTQALAEQRYVEQTCLEGKVKLLYVSPEKLQTDAFRAFLSYLPVNLFAVDEAHCISFWGHDFRPEYKQLSVLKKQFPDIPIIALTATADRLTRQDILTQLDLHEPRVFISSFDRQNFFLEVRPAQDRINQIVRFLLQRPDEAGIIYCLSRKTTEQIAEKLRQKGFNAAAYHAGLDQSERSRTQDDFLKDRTLIICATVAFGMGIDKSNVRFVIHYNLPKNIESYYQEIGRAGRDGLPAYALLFYTYSDVNMQREMLNEEESDIKEVKLAKLDRLQQFAESNLCRRRILLNYFNENYDHNCGQCDVCRSPRQQFEATREAQKILSAVARVKNSEPIGTITDILRGHRSPKILGKGYQDLKTFGAGKDRKILEWNDFIAQLINLGYLEMAYDKHNALMLTPKSNAVLFGNESVTLARHISKEEQAAAKETAKIAAGTANPLPNAAEPPFRKPLFDKLRELRRQIAEEIGVPPFVVFHDNTLRQMAIYLPQNEPQMLNINGIGARKMAAYGQSFLDVIINFVAQDNEANEADKSETPPAEQEKNQLPPKTLLKKALSNAEYRALLGMKLAQLRDKIAEHYQTNAPKIYTDGDIDSFCAQMPIGTEAIVPILTNQAGNREAIAKAINKTILKFLTEEGAQMKTVSAKVSYAFALQGLSVDEISEKRFLSPQTIIGHLADFYRQGYPLDIEKYITQPELDEITPYLRQKEAYPNHKAIFEALDQKYDYAKIKWAEADLHRNNNKP